MSMDKPWYDDLAPDEEKVYEEAINRIRNAVKKSLSFKQAAALVDMEDEGLRASILDDALKVLIAENHFSGHSTLEDMARTLKLPIKRLEKAKQEMLKDVEQAAIEKYKAGHGPVGNA